jgi:ribonuclease H-related protein
MALKKYYAVKGPGISEIFHDWPTCEAKVRGVKGIKFKGFALLEDAKEFLGQETKPLIGLFGFIDGSFGSLSPYAGWGVVVVQDGTELQRLSGITPLEALSRNIDGELFAAYTCAKWAQQNNKKICICYDYKGIEEWATGRWKANSAIAKWYIQMMDPLLPWVTFKKVAAHSGNRWNDIADKLAKDAISAPLAS